MDQIYIVYVLSSFKDYSGTTVDYIKQYLFEYEQYEYYRHPEFRNKLIEDFLEDNKLNQKTEVIIDIVPTEFILSKKHRTNKNEANLKLN